MFQLSALVGVEPWNYTLRELSWMAKAREMYFWDGIAWVCAYAGTALFAKSRITVEDFHPIRGRVKRANLGKLEKQFKELKKILPPTLSPDEIQKRWEEFKARGGS